MRRDSVQRCPRSISCLETFVPLNQAILGSLGVPFKCGWWHCRLLINKTSIWIVGFVNQESILMGLDRVFYGGVSTAR